MVGVSGSASERPWSTPYCADLEFPPLAGHGCYAARVLVV